MIPAIQEQKEYFLKKIQIAKGFWYSDERLAKELWISRANLWIYRIWEKVLMSTYLELNTKLEKFIIEHLEKKKDIYYRKIQEAEELQSDVLKISNK